MCCVSLSGCCALGVLTTCAWSANYVLTSLKETLSVARLFALRTYEKHGRLCSRRRVRRRLSSVFKRGGRRRRRPPAHCGCLEHTHRQRGRLRPLHHHSHPARCSRKDRFRRIVIFTQVAPARLGRRVRPRACAGQEICGARQRAVVRVRRPGAGHQPGPAALHVLGS